MGSFSMTHQNGNNFCVYELGPEEELDTFVLGMLSNNEIKNTLPMQVLHQDGHTYYRYNISGMLPFEYVYQDNMSRKVFLGVLEGITEALLDAREYMIEPVSIDWGYSHIFVDQKSNAAKLMILPVDRGEADFDVYEFVRELVFRAKLDMSENGAYHSELIRFLNNANAGSFSLEQFLVLLHQLTDHTEKAPQLDIRTMPPAPEPSPARVHAPSRTAPSAPAPAPQPVSKGIAEDVKKTPAPAPQPEAKEVRKVPAQEPDMFAFPGEKEFAKDFGTDSSPAKAEESHKAPKGMFSNALKGLRGAFESKSAKRTEEDGFEMETPVDREIAAAFEQPAKKQEAEKQARTDTGKSSAQVLSGSKTVYYQDEMQKAGQSKTVMYVDAMAEAQLRPFLIRKKNNERIPIVMRNGRFRIGTNPDSNLEYLITDNRFISGFHAQIIQKDKDYYLMDMNSSNGTSLDGERIFVGQEHLLISQMRIKLANEEFEFRLEQS